MKILLTGANGYIGKRLLPELLAKGHEVVCCVRDKDRFPIDDRYKNANISVLEVDFLKDNGFHESLANIDAAYYLIHSMSDNSPHFDLLEETAAHNFVKLVQNTQAKQIIYLGGITNEQNLSKHLASRKRVDEILLAGGIPLTSLKAGIIVGSGSSSFEIIRDLVEKLPIMITPKWLNTRIQPIAIRNVLEYLSGILLKKETFNQSYDIGGPDILTYKQMLLQFAEVRGLKRYIITLPVMTPRISSYWLYFVTSTNYKLAVHLVNSMKVEVVARNNKLESLLNITPLSYKEAVSLAFQKIEQNNVISSWKDSIISSSEDNSLLSHIDVPSYGCFEDKKTKLISGNTEDVLNNIWAIGGERGWYYGNWLWRIRGFIDKLFGGVGLRRGRTNENHINTGDTLDFWRVLVADRKSKRLLLFAEMKLPGEAWLEFKIIARGDQFYLQQTATFRPKGLLGRLYWYSVLPFHYFVFNGMAQNIVNFKLISQAAKHKTKINSNERFL
ncbi:MAG: SDR family oxidoreductase [Bacteroidales bacterium]|nr:SDR family oxidoreductase [Bacteroidales bacterium]